MDEFNCTEDLLMSLKQPIAVIRNADSSFQLGNFIESYNAIIRINNFMISGYEEKVGKSTTHWCVNCGALLSDKEFSLADGKDQAILFAPLLKKNMEISRFMKRISKIPVCCKKSHTCRSNSSKYDVHDINEPTVGFILASTFSSLGIMVDIFNFDFLSSGHYFDRSHDHVTSHIEGGKIERDILLNDRYCAIFSVANDDETISDNVYSVFPEHATEKIGLTLFQGVLQDIVLSIHDKFVVNLGYEDGKLSEFFRSINAKVYAIDIPKNSVDNSVHTKAITAKIISVAEFSGPIDYMSAMNVLPFLQYNDVLVFFRVSLPVVKDMHNFDST